MAAVLQRANTALETRTATVHTDSKYIAIIIPTGAYLLCNERFVEHQNDHTHVTELYIGVTRRAFFLPAPAPPQERLNKNSGRKQRADDPTMSEGLTMLALGAITMSVHVLSSRVEAVSATEAGIRKMNIEKAKKEKELRELERLPSSSYNNVR